MNDHLKNGLPEQAGFMSMKGQVCSDATFTFKMTLQNLWGANQDWISWKLLTLWIETLEKYGIPKITIATIKKMYMDINIKLIVEDAQFIFNSISGIKQGDNLTAALFLFVDQATIETMHANWSSISIQTPDIKHFPSKNNGYLSKCDPEK